jgi:hypothetical protein
MYEYSLTLPVSIPAMMPQQDKDCSPSDPDDGSSPMVTWGRRYHDLSSVTEDFTRGTGQVWTEEEFSQLLPRRGHILPQSLPHDLCMGDHSVFFTRQSPEDPKRTLPGFRLCENICEGRLLSSEHFQLNGGDKLVLKFGDFDVFRIQASVNNFVLASF